MRELDSVHLMDDAANLKAKVILITGGASGFGKNTAQLAASYGAKVVIADLNLGLAEETVEEIRKDGGICSAPNVGIDVTKPDVLRKAFEHCLSEYGRAPDVVYANAGVSSNDLFEEDMEVAETATKPAHPRPPRFLTTNVDLNGAVLTCAMAQEYWKNHPAPKGESRKRRLVVLSSMAGQTALPAATTYTTSKHALLAYWQEICKTLEAQSEDAVFEFYAICPFFARTKILEAAVLLILAGIPLVPVPLIAKTMIHVASRPSKGAPGGVVLLPDHGNPAIATAAEYDALSPDWTAAMHARCSKTDGWKKVGAWRRIWRDIALNFFGTSSLGLASRVIVFLGVIVGIGILGVRHLIHVPMWAVVVVGALVGLTRT